MLETMAGRRLLLRILVALAFILAAFAFVLGFLPGAHVYRYDVFVETVDVVESWNWFLGYLVLLLAPGVVVWRRPRIAFALAWSLWTVGVTVLLLVATFDFGDWSVRHVVLPAQQVFGYTMAALLGHLILVVPVACAIAWWFTRERPEPPVTLPMARVVRR
jgi:hypothetical protein